jgi:hypothetical protein
MDQSKPLYDALVLLFSVIAGLWAVITLVLNKRRENVEWISQLYQQLQATSDIVMENPELQLYPCEHYDTPAETFKQRGDIQRDERFVRVKSLIYCQLNAFDALISKTQMQHTRSSAVRVAQSLSNFLFFPGGAELRNWQAFVIEKLRHPFFQAVLEEEEVIFGDALIQFYRNHAKTIRSRPPLQYLW